MGDDNSVDDEEAGCLSLKERGIFDLTLLVEVDVDTEARPKDKFP
jgi:hypothetical protein